MPQFTQPEGGAGMVAGLPPLRAVHGAWHSDSSVHVCCRCCDSALAGGGRHPLRGTVSGFLFWKTILKLGSISGMPSFSLAQLPLRLLSSPLD